MNKNTGIGMVIAGIVLLVAGFVLCGSSWKKNYSFVQNLSTAYIRMTPNETKEVEIQLPDVSSPLYEYAKMRMDSGDKDTVITSYGTTINLSTIIIISFIMTGTGLYFAVAKE